MTRTYNRWIFTKSCDNSPEGNLRLGQILAKPKDPAYVLQPLGPLPLDGRTINTNQTGQPDQSDNPGQSDEPDQLDKPNQPTNPLASDVIMPEVTSRSNVNMHDVSELSAQFSVWANLGHVPAQFKASSSTTHKHDLEWHFDKLESKIMSPTLAYVQKAMRHGDVEASLKNWKHPFKRHVYMVTGVRVVNGARMRRKDTSSSDNTALAEATAPDRSVSAGTQAGLATKLEESEEFDKATDFVFAYRLNQVKYRGTITHKPYTKGETASADRPVERGRPEVEINDFEVYGTGIEDIDFEDEEDDFERVEVPGYEDLESYLGKDNDDDDD